MPAPTTTAALLEVLRKSGLVEGGSLDAYLQERPLPPEPRRATDVLVRDGLLTPFQAGQLLAGKHKGFHLGPYRLLRPLGEGGMGKVYLAQHTKLGRPVALKFLPPDRGQDPAALQRFHREGRAVAALDHPNIVRAHDTNRDGNLHYLVMEYVEGRSLEEVMRRQGPVPPREAVGYILQAAAGLQHACERGIVHRDVKPANLLRQPDGTVKVLDMGLARFFQDASDDLTRHLEGDATLGTADYIAPEQALDSHAADTRSDVYSLGATLYALLNGAPPFGGRSTSQKLLAHQLRSPRRVHEVRPEVPAGLSDVVARMMAKRPEDRYQTPAEAMAALAPWGPSAGGRERQEDAARSAREAFSSLPLSPSSRPLARRPFWPKVVAAAVSTLLAAAAGGWWLSARNSPPPASDPSRPPEEVTRPGPTPTPPSPTAYQLDLRGQLPFRLRRTGEGVDEWKGEPPPSWSGHVWDAGSASEFVAEEVEGVLALGVRNVEGRAAGMWWLCDLRLQSGRRYRLEVVYLTRGDASGLVRAGRGRKDMATLGRLKPSDGEWATAELFLEPADGDAPRLEFHNPAVGADHTLYLRNVELTDVGPPPADATPFRWDLRREKPSLLRLKGRKAVHRTGKLPDAWSASVWDADSTGEFVVEPAAGVTALGVRNVEGQAAGMLFLGALDLKAGRRYRLKVVYLTLGRGHGLLKVRAAGKTATHLGGLKGTGGQWRTAEFVFVRDADGPTFLEFHNRARGEDSTLYLQQVEVVRADAE